MKPFQEGKTFYACGTAITVAEDSSGETHVYRTSDGEKLSESNLKFGVVFGGGKDSVVSETNVEMKSGFLRDIYGGGSGGAVENCVNITLSGGMIGGYMYGGGAKDTVGDINVTVTGGAIKYGFYGGGISLEYGNLNINFDGIVSTNVRTGSRYPDAVAKGEVQVNMADGHVLELIASNNYTGNTYIEVTGGKIEKQILNSNPSGKMYIKLYSNIFEPDGLGGSYPKLPENAEIEYLPEIAKDEYAEPSGSDAEFFDTSDDSGKLVFRFFELRHPDMPYTLTPFPAFIGDCFLISLPDGSTMLVDTGMPYSCDEIYDGLVKLGIKRIDYLMLTHAHTDHIGNGELIIKNFEIGEIWLPETREEAALPGEEVYFEALKKLLAMAEDRGVKIKRVGMGDIINVGEGDKRTEFFIVNPDKEDKSVTDAGDLNKFSIACKVTYKDNSAVLCGDITDTTEGSLAKIYGDFLKTDLLKASHHGIVYQNFYTFIDACAPRYIVVPSMRDRGVFLKTTSYSLEHVNGFDNNNLYVAGKWGKIKVVMSGIKDDVKLITEYKY